MNGVGDEGEDHKGGQEELFECLTEIGAGIGSVS